MKFKLKQMKIELSIKDDKELRDYIKNMIKGQVMSIAREEIKDIISNVFADKVMGLVKSNPETIVRQELQSLIKKDIEANNYGQSSFIRQVAREEVSKIAKELFSKGI